jgi:hypothetical protein
MSGPGSGPRLDPCFGLAALAATHGPDGTAALGRQGAVSAYLDHHGGDDVYRDVQLWTRPGGRQDRTLGASGA